MQCYCKTCSYTTKPFPFQCDLTHPKTGDFISSALCWIGGEHLVSWTRNHNIFFANLKPSRSESLLKVSLRFKGRSRRFHLEMEVAFHHHQNISLPGSVQASICFPSQFLFSHSKLHAQQNYQYNKFVLDCQRLSNSTVCWQQTCKLLTLTMYSLKELRVLLKGD